MKRDYPYRAAACLLFVVGFGGCQQAKPAAQSEEASRRAASAVTRVTAGPAVRKTLKLYTEQPGRVAAFEETPIFSKLAGYVESVHADIGDQVKKGQLLIRLSVPEYQDQLEQKRGLFAQVEAQVKQAEAALVASEAAASSAQAFVAQAEAGIGRVEGEYARWDSERNRIQQLVNTGSVTTKLADETLSQFRAAEAARQETIAGIDSAKAKQREAEAKVLTAQADLEASKSQLRVAKAEIAQAETMLNYAELKAPYDGVLTERRVDTGHYVQPAGSSAGVPLMTVVAIDKVRIYVDVPESEAAFIDAGYSDQQAGDAAIIRSPSLKALAIEARVTRTSETLDRQSRSLVAEIDVPNAEKALLPGAYVTVQILLEQRDNVMTLPVTAIVGGSAETLCCVVVDGKIEMRPIQLGLRAGNDVEIKTGLEGNENIVMVGAGSLQAGQPVEIIAKK